MSQVKARRLSHMGPPPPKQIYGQKDGPRGPASGHLVRCALKVAFLSFICTASMDASAHPSGPQTFTDTHSTPGPLREQGCRVPWAPGWVPWEDDRGQNIMVSSAHRGGAKAAEARGSEAVLEGSRPGRDGSRCKGQRPMGRGPKNSWSGLLHKGQGG